MIKLLDKKTKKVVTEVLKEIIKFDASKLELEETTGMIEAERQIKQKAKELYNINL